MNFCEHQWCDIGGIHGLVDYRGVVINGTHIRKKCDICGKEKFILFWKNPFHILCKREENPNWPKERQMEFI